MSRMCACNWSRGAVFRQKCLLGVGLLWLSLAVAAKPLATRLYEDDIREHWLASAINYCPENLHLLVLEHRSGEYLVRQLDLQMLGLSLPDAPLHYYRSERFYRLDQVQDLVMAADGKQIDITLPGHGPLCQPEPEVKAPETLLLTLTLNQQPQQGIMVAERGGEGDLWLPVDYLANLRVRLPEGGRREIAGQHYIAISAFTAAEWQLHRQRMHLDMTLPMTWLRASRWSAEGTDKAPPVASASGVFINYDFYAQQQQRDDSPHSNTGGGVVELGVFAPGGLFTQTGLYRYLGTERDDQWLRLESRWQRDNPERMTTTIVGDSQLQPGSWGRPVRYGGISWGTNFATRPDLITFPQPALSAEAATASTVDIYVNNMRRASTDVPAGPFTVDQLPIITGAGNVQLVTRDLLGRETVINQPFYGSAELLREGLYAYNYTLGAVREGYGRINHRYGDSFVATTHRYGITDWLTGELRAELDEDRQTYGLAASVTLGNLGALHWSGATSSNRQGVSGQMHELRLERSGRHFSFGARARLVEPGFTQLSHSVEPEGRSRTWQAFASTRLGPVGALSVSYLDRDTEQLDSRIVNLGYTTQIGGSVSLLLNASHTLDDEEADTLFYLSLVMPLGRGSSASLSGRQRGEEVEGRFALQHTPPSRGGLGVRAEQYLGDRSDQALYTEWRTDYARLRADVIKRNDNLAYRAGLRGSLVHLGGRAFAADWVSGSFAAIATPGLSGVPVYRENRHVTDTRRDGWAFVNQLRPFANNHIRLDERDLPLDVHLQSNARQQLVPGYRRGLVIEFDLKRERAAVLTLVDSQGKPLPAGTQVEAALTGEVFTVGWEGMTYLTGIDKDTPFTARWQMGECHFSVTYPDTRDPQPELGKHVCIEN